VKKACCSPVVAGAVRAPEQSWSRTLRPQFRPDGVGTGRQHPRPSVRQTPASSQTA
jgi:hypothetical protein